MSTPNFEDYNQNTVSIDDEYNGLKKIHIVKHFGKLEQIEEIHASQYDHDHFMKNYMGNNRPLLIRQALASIVMHL